MAVRLREKAMKAYERFLKNLAKLKVEWYLDEDRGRIRTFSPGTKIGLDPLAAVANKVCGTKFVSANYCAAGEALGIEFWKRGEIAHAADNYDTEFWKIRRELRSALHKIRRDGSEEKRGSIFAFYQRMRKLQGKGIAFQFFEEWLRKMPERMDGHWYISSTGSIYRSIMWNYDPVTALWADLFHTHRQPPIWTVAAKQINMSSRLAKVICDAALNVRDCEPWMRRLILDAVKPAKAHDPYFGYSYNVSG